MPGNRPLTAEDLLPTDATPNNAPRRARSYQQILSSLAEDFKEKPIPPLRLKIGDEVTIVGTHYKKLNPKHVGVIINIISYGRASDIVVKMREGKYKGQSLYLSPKNCIKINKSKVPGWF